MPFVFLEGFCTAFLDSSSFASPATMAKIIAVESIKKF